jgi:hypothetical protein
MLCAFLLIDRSLIVGRARLGQQQRGRAER